MIVSKQIREWLRSLPGSFEADEREGVIAMAKETFEEFGGEEIPLSQFETLLNGAGYTPRQKVDFDGEGNATSYYWALDLPDPEWSVAR